MNTILPNAINSAVRIAKKYKVILLSIAVFSFSFLPLIAILPMVATIAFCGYYLPLGTKSSILFRFVLSLIIATCLQQVLGMLFWIIGLPLTIHFVVGTQLAIGLLLYSKFRHTKERPRFTSINDSVSFLISLFSLVIISVFISRSGISSNTLLRFSIPAIDDTVHLGLIMADYNNSGYIYGPSRNSAHDFNLPKLNSYPQGWHFSNSLWWHAVSNNLTVKNTNGLRSVLIAFSTTKLLWYGLTIFMICKLILHLSDFATKDVRPIFKAAFLSILIGFVQLMWLLQLLDSGFSSLSPQMVFILSITYIIYEFSRKRISLKSYMLIGSLLISGLSLTWLLAAPAGGIALVLGVLVSCKQRYRDTLIELIKPGNRLATLFGAAIALIGLMQIFVQVFYSKGSTINEGGGIFIIDSSFYILTILLTLGLIYLAKSRLATIQTIVATLVGPALSVGVLYLYQTMTIHRADYYYYKLSWVVLVLLFVFSATTIVVLFTRLAQAVKLFPSFMSLIAIIVFYVSIIQIVLPGSDFLIFGWSAIDEDVARNILVNSAAIQASGPNSSNNIVVASNNQEEDIVAYAFMHNTLNNQYEPGKCNIPMGSQRTNDTYQFYNFDEYTRCPIGQKYIIFAGNNYRDLSLRFRGDDDIVIIR